MIWDGTLFISFVSLYLKALNSKAMNIAWTPKLFSTLYRARLLICIAAGAVLLPSTSSAQVVYRENFNNSTSGNLPASSVGWSLWMADGFNAGFAPAETTGGVSNNSNSIAAGPNLGQSDTSAATSGFFFAGGFGAATTNLLAYTSEYTGATVLNRSTLQSIRFYQGNSNGTDAQFRIALQIGGDWYVSSAQSGNNVGNTAAFGLGAVQLTFSSFTAEDWYTLDSSTLAVGGTAVELPTGTVQSFGFFANKADLDPVSTTVRVDVYEVYAIPEPSTVLLLLGGVGALLFLRFRNNVQAPNI